MKEIIDHKIFKVIAEAADELQMDTYVVGGYVRDKILGRKNSKDIDFVSVGSGITLAKLVAKKLGRSKIAVFKNFGTAQVKYKDLELEFVGARKESYNRDSRKPIVEDGTLDDDQKRRDFTINAMAVSLNAKNYGELLDPFGGVSDLENKIIRTPLDPHITYSDDPLRMMRAIRFASQLNFKIEEKSFQAILETKERIDIISKERVSDELNKIMLSPKPSVGLRLFYESGLMAYFLPEIIALKGVEEVDGQLHKDNFYHTLQVVDNISETTDNLWLRYAALFHDIGKPVTKKFIKGTGWTFHNHEFVGSKMVFKIFKRLKLPLSDKLKYVQKIVRMSSRPIAVTDDQATDSAARRLLFDAGDHVNDLMLLCEADITTQNKKKKAGFLENFKTVRARLKEVEESDQIRNFQPPVDGAEIMEIFNIPPGREIGIIKEFIKEAILEGSIKNNHEEALALAVEKGKELGLDTKQ
ncbi:CCA tRNA nucleotidyltransferase [Owenweeksia hongkongensis]|uniref:CCA tRNA nucleotidyltransferase n=1 Tax=Owenweeksia hongkongensis TaxID=253245 RepID=UPI003A9579EC